jgi:hypothetical protein
VWGVNWLLREELACSSVSRWWGIVCAEGWPWIAFRLNAFGTSLWRVGLLVSCCVLYLIWFIVMLSFVMLRISAGHNSLMLMSVGVSFSFSGGCDWNFWYVLST